MTMDEEIELELELEKMVKGLLGEDYDVDSDILGREVFITVWSSIKKEPVFIKRYRMKELRTGLNDLAHMIFLEVLFS